ncbi:hypothetical protein FHU38_005401 [Saccharomonospora amisosensis]|uniref:Uncharacterized protein n=1 Tax=Saccharomonospora amisosensis TaxID=1128677 RepID=A0A7X5ZTH3_9PSEU|nr:hypothetical protein [Saccharomonospora amisosensis]NIJ14993.1 hypothetical protein [Saccharomonospora amisosensis]
MPDEGLAVFRRHHRLLSVNPELAVRGEFQLATVRRFHALRDKVYLKARVEQVLRSATDVDSDFCKVLKRVLARNTIDAGAYDNESTSLSAAGNAGAALGSLSIPAPPPANASPAQNAAWWASLSEAQRQRFTNDYPQLSATATVCREVSRPCQPPPARAEQARAPDSAGRRQGEQPLVQRPRRP